LNADSPASVNAASLTLQPDTSRLSPFAQLMSRLQQLQQSDPAKYQQVTGQIATNLETASQTALANGNTTAAARLDQLSKDFTSASKSGQLPNVQDLAQAVAGHRHGHHHHAHAASSDSDANSNSSAPAGQAINPLLAALQSNAAGNDVSNPMSIVESTLSQSGITGS
jgi:hypothetical protein